VRILYVVTSTNIGGTEKVLCQLVRSLDRRRYDPVVCCLKKPGGYAQRLASHAEGFYSLGLSEAGGVRALATFFPALVRLVRVTREVRPHIVHSFLFRANILARLAAAAAGVPVCISSIRVIEPAGRLKNLVDRMTASRVTAYTAVSEAVRTYIHEQIGVPFEKIVTIYNGIEKEKVADPETVSCQPETSGGRQLFIGLFGRFDKQKGHDILIAAARRLLENGCNVKIYFYGEGPNEAFLRRMVRDGGLESRVAFMGVTDSVQECMAGMDIIVQPSLWEGMPNAVLEAMAAGKPVVASRISGIDEMVIDGDTGLLCEPGNPVALAEALQRLYSRPREAVRMGQRAAQQVREHFTFENTFARTLELYNRLCRQQREG
jgi:glycosyltransferase involved in cell wall biosynthesis